MFRYALYDPDPPVENLEGEGADTLDAAEPTPTSEGDSGAGQPAPEGPSIEGLTGERDTLKTQLEQFNVMAGVLRDAGVTKIDDLKAKLTPAKPAPTDIQAILASLGKEPQKAALPAKSADLSYEDLKQLIGDTVGAALGQHVAQQEERSYTEAAAVENSLKGRVFSDPRFKSLTGGGSFAEAFQGKKGQAAKAFAILADHMFYERGLSGSDGTYKPVTDVAAVNDIVSTLVGFMGEMKAATIHELSKDPSAPESPDVPSETPEAVIMAELGESAFDILDPEESAARSKRDAAIRKTFEQTFKGVLAGQEGAPLSQGF